MRALYAQDPAQATPLSPLERSPTAKGYFFPWTLTRVGSKARDAGFSRTERKLLLRKRWDRLEPTPGSGW
jgi:hypothetical protein